LWIGEDVQHEKDLPVAAHSNDRPRGTSCHLEIEEAVGGLENGTVGDLILWKRTQEIEACLRGGRAAREAQQRHQDSRTRNVHDPPQCNR
jgi:hypothetical protein